MLGASHWFNVEEERDAWVVVPPWEGRSHITSKRTKTEPANRYIESLYFIPYNSHSALNQWPTKLEIDLGYNSRTKFLEEMGMSLREELCRAEPDPQHCGRTDCFPAKPPLASA